MRAAEEGIKLSVLLATAVGAAVLLAKFHGHLVTLNIEALCRALGGG